MEKTSVALPAARKGGRKGRSDLVLERNLLFLPAEKEGAALLLTKALSVFKTLTDVAKVLMDEHLAGDRARLVKEAVHTERRAARSEEPISAEAAAAVLVWSRQLFTTIMATLSIRGKELCDGVHVFSENSDQVAVQRVINHYGQGQKLPRMGEVLLLFEKEIPATCTSLLLLVALLRSRSCGRAHAVALMRSHRDVARASGIDAGSLLAAKFLKFLQNSATLAPVSMKAATPSLDFAQLITGMQDHLDIHGDVVFGVARVPALAPSRLEGGGGARRETARSSAGTA